MFMAAEAELRLNDAGCEGVAASTKQWNKLPYISCSGGEDRSDVCNESKLEAVLAHGDSEQDCSPWLSLSFGGLCVRNMWVSRNHSLWCDRGGHLWGHRRLFVIVVRICYFAHPALLVFLWGTPSLLLAALPVLISRGFLLPAKGLVTQPGPQSPPFPECSDLKREAVCSRFILTAAPWRCSPFASIPRS